ncbi:hypothetical protein BDY19DRAFT_719597 [Irpex rosettiformis]|uniref:Uncharacterized protein n=1 Tax=Irpex rosettiformis TaxID=378272 RepID=A0ACB8U8M8_9APHY|nr:hypothetical protein BDY19DRAFT_719597 [Irpex rosettiformis]
MCTFRRFQHRAEGYTIVYRNRTTFANPCRVHVSFIPLPPFFMMVTKCDNRQTNKNSDAAGFFDTGAWVKRITLHNSLPLQWDNSDHLRCITCTTTSMFPPHHAKLQGFQTMVHKASPPVPRLWFYYNQVTILPYITNLSTSSETREGPYHISTRPGLLQTLHGRPLYHMLSYIEIHIPSVCSSWHGVFKLAWMVVVVDTHKNLERHASYQSPGFGFKSRLRFPHSILPVKLYVLATFNSDCCRGANARANILVTRDQGCALWVEITGFHVHTHH